MADPLLLDLVKTAKSYGINVGFLTSPHERDIWLEGFRTTLTLVATVIPVSLAAGMALAAALTARQRWLALPARVFVELTRNTPTLVQLSCAFLGLNMLISQTLGGAGQNPFGAFFWVVLVVGLHGAAYHAEALRAGIEAVPDTTLEAARALGFNRLEILRWVELPLALRIALPTIVNNLVTLVKLTTVGSAVAVGEITYASIMIWTQRDNVVELMVVILVFFSAINLVVSQIGLWLERRLAVPGLGVRS
ncbi:amino acid ABC transporter permease [Azospirillum sp.]|uniref:amino acid ABC transporter permease n=1 Tax=Azospirillum sp. TaxID=34012 RepID=UPI00260B5F68|nr:amino acid ABC transporter permease [Azospirillum sp.]